jgi:hypothetical protein
MNNEKLTDTELDKVVGGVKYYTEDIYRRNHIALIDGGATCYYKEYEVSEDEAAALVFYRTRFPDSIIDDKIANKGWDRFIQEVNNYRYSNSTAFEHHYKTNGGVFTKQ